MNNIKKLGLTALAGSLVASSAYAGALDVSGGASIKYKSDDDDEVTGNSFSMGKGISFSGSGELDNGYTMSYSYTMTDAAFSSQNIMLDMGDAGSVGVGNGASGAGLRAYKYVLPTAGEEVWDDTDGDDNGVAVHGDTNAVYYKGSFGGFGISAAYAGNTGVGSDSSVVLTYDGLMDGLSIGYGTGENNTTSDLMTAFAKYSVGSVTVGVQKSEIDNASGSDEDAMGYAISLAVNENMSVSYGIWDVDMGAGAEDEESAGLSASYTTGGMTIGVVSNATDSVAGTAGDDDTFTEVAVSFAF
tara:strand:+ start:408 stop:1310 length:903 start_codon:yes stop_codon:yes gene_type:complete